MRTINLNMIAIDLESKIFDALINLGLKTSKVLDIKNHECHFITQIKINKHITYFPLQNVSFTPIYKKSANESLTKIAFHLRTENTGRRFIADELKTSIQIFDFSLFPLN